MPSRGEPGLLLGLLDGLARQTYPRDRFEILVAVDGAQVSDEVRAQLDALQARVVPLNERAGPGAARNRAAALASGEFLAFTEDDVLPAADWLAVAAARLDADPALDVLEGRTIRLSQRSVPASDLPLYLPTNLFVRRAMFEQNGGYSEAFFDPGAGIYFREDADLGFTLEEAGARIAREPGAVVTHPVEHTRWLDPLRWARRYEMDALLAARHPWRFRDRIEVQRLGPFTVRRPIVRAATVYVLALGGALIALLAGQRTTALGLAALAGLALLPVWAKWQLNPLRLPVVLLVPFVMLASLLHGRRRVPRP